MPAHGARVPGAQPQVVGADGRLVEVSPPGTVALGARRAYLEVLAVFAAFFASGIAAAAASLTTSAGSAGTGGPVGWADALPAGLEQLATTGLCIAVPVLLAQRRGLPARTLGLVRHRQGGPSGPQQLRTAAWALLALVGGSLVTAALATGDAGLPASPSVPLLAVELLHALQAGPIEELVVLAFTVVTLEQARRPRWEIVAVALVLRVSYHIYYGPGVVGILVWASVFLWLFVGRRSVVPLIAVHSSWDVVVTLAQSVRAVAGVGFLAICGIVLAAGITWLLERGRRRTPEVWAAPPGWYPDPSGVAASRWFDGWRWTTATWPPPPGAPPPARAWGG